MPVEITPEGRKWLGGAPAGSPPPTQSPQTPELSEVEGLVEEIVRGLRAGVDVLRRGDIRSAEYEFDGALELTGDLKFRLQRLGLRITHPR
jgi:hypothetical protein